jgi:nucleotide-binding universal stress UspA family protein
LSSTTALPEQILIPLANPRTAADLVRIGAGLLRSGGTITALGIVEVAEGVPLSEGATRARQARRLLQRVLEFVPQGIELRTVVRIGRKAAEGIVEVAAEERSDLIIFGWSGRPAGKRGTATVAEAVFSPTIDDVVRDAPCNIAVIKQLEQLKVSAADRMQNYDAYMNPSTHHLQQTIYMARRNDKPVDKTDLFEILSWTKPEDALDARDDDMACKLESYDSTPTYEL